MNDKIYNSPEEEKVSNWSNFLDILIIVIFLLVIIFISSELNPYLNFSFYLGILILIFAIFRLTKLLVSDHITQFFRDIFFDITKEGDLVKRQFPKNSIKRKIAKLLDCPWCTSVWVALISIFVWFKHPETHFFFFVMALSGLGTILFLLMKKLK